MPEKVTVHELTDRTDFFSFLIFGAISDYDVKNPGFVEKLALTAHTDGLQIALVVNGQEVPLKPMVKEIQNQHNRLIEKKAQELLADRARDLSTRLAQLEETIKREADALFPLADEDRY